MDRRSFLQNTGLMIGGSVLAQSCSAPASATTLGSWDDIRAQFPLAKDKIHMAQMFLASHPKPVADEIERHRKMFDAAPVNYFEDNFKTIDNKIAESAAKYMGCTPQEVGLTDSTTQGLATIYNGLTEYCDGGEILTSTHDHYATEKCLEFAAARAKAVIKRIDLYEDPSKANAADIVDRISKNISEKTRVIALTWVHSSTGVKIPVAMISEMVAKHNESRDAKIIFCVDGVHGFGVDASSIEQLGCDFFAAGTHKWLFGPRGTGIMYGKKKSWHVLRPTTPAFTYAGYGHWLGLTPPNYELTFMDLYSPGGFHNFESRWALNTAFDWMMTIGKPRIARRTEELSTRLKAGLTSISHIRLLTPTDPSLSAGINCFDVDGLQPDDVVKKLLEQHHIIASAAPYKRTCVRLTPSIVNNEEEVDRCLSALQAIKV
jgi:selenocysteine lyase/cysteine desulfurase